MGNHVVLIGSKTGRDGIGGASVLASQVFDETLEEKRPSVQVGDPFTEKKLLEACLELLRGDLLVALQDLGAAGITSSSSEMAAKGEVGIDLHADRVPLREADMEPWEIMISESQERMLAIVTPGRLGRASRRSATAGTSTAPSWARSPTPSTCGSSIGGEMVGDMDAVALAEPPTYDIPQERPAHEVDEPLDPDGRIRRRTRRSPRSCSTSSARPTSPAAAGCGSSTTIRCSSTRCIVPGGDAALLRVKKTGAGHRRLHRRQRPPDLPRPVSGRQGGGGRGGAQRLLRRREAHRHHQLPQLRQPRQRPIAYQLARAIEGMAEACEALRHAGHLGQRVPLQRELRAAHLSRRRWWACWGCWTTSPPTVTPASRRRATRSYLLGDAAPALDGSEYQKRWYGRRGGRPHPRRGPGGRGAPSSPPARDSRWLVRCGPRLLRRRPRRDAGRDLPAREAGCPGGAGPEPGDGPGRPDDRLFGEAPTRVVVSVPAGARARSVPVRRGGRALRRIG